jgi:hypothetical protein
MPQPTDDDIYVNAGDDMAPNGVFYPGEPAEQKQEEREQHAKIAQSLPIMDDVADWFRDAIIECDNLDNIKIDELVIDGITYRRQISVEAQILAHQLLKSLLGQKLLEFDEFGKHRHEDE